MNFSFKTKKGKKKKDSALGFGLNSRKKKKTFSSLVGDSCSADEDEQNNDSSKGKVNRELAAEQAALRRRAEKAMCIMSSEYDYDAEYESFSTSNKLKKTEKATAVDDMPKESRYIATLVEKAKERQQEREIIKERKIAREQELEDCKQDFLGKEKFITSAYKKKLEERKVWLEKDAKLSRLEEEEDVTKRKGDGVMGFYSNFTNNVAVGCVQTDVSNQEFAKELDSVYQKRKTALDVNRDPEMNVNNSTSLEMQDIIESEEEMEVALLEQSMIVKRLQKIFKARERYLERKRSTE